MLSARMLGLTVQRVSAGEELVVCPFHNDNHASAWFSPEKELFYCAVCGIGLNARSLIRKMGSDLDLDELIEQAKDEIPDLDLVIEPHTIPFGNPDLRPSYYEERGISDEVIEMYGLEYSVAMGSIVFPVHNVTGSRIGSVQRFLHAEVAGTRYKKSGTMTPIWPLDKLGALKQGDRVFITEGVWSALRLATWGRMNKGRGLTFCLFGAKANQEIVDVLRPFNPVFLYDNDEAGRNACAKMRGLLHRGHAFTLAKAPDDMNDKEIQDMLVKLWKAIK